MKSLRNSRVSLILGRGYLAGSMEPTWRTLSARREFEVAVNDDACSGGNELAEFAQRGFDDDLEVAGAASVVDFQERESVLVGFASRLHPAANARLPTGKARAAIDVGDDGLDGDVVGEIIFGNLVEGDGGELIHQWRRCVCHWC